MPYSTRISCKGFTLIEISIVLVIIGLIVGGILTGQDLINAATIRAQIAQIEKYNTAVRTFQGKYGYLPGDIPNPYATSFGFQARGTYAGEGDGNGIIEGNCADTSTGNSGFQQGCSELAVFWEDISTPGFIDSKISGYDIYGNNYPAILHTNGSGVTASSTPALKDWLPSAKIGTGNYIYIFSLNGTNYWGLSSVTKIGWKLESTANPGLSVLQASNIDSKIDDGLPQAGKVTACYVNYDVSDGVAVWAAANNLPGAGSVSCVNSTAATPIASTNCYDNGNSVGTQKYSLSQNGNLQNCALSFKFQ